MKIMDFQNNGMGDVVLGSWITTSALAINEEIFINPRNHLKVTQLLQVPEHLITKESGGNWTQLKNRGFIHELERGHFETKSRFSFWAESFNLKNLTPIRPKAAFSEEKLFWAEYEWQKLDPDHSKPRVLLFTEATRITRTWSRYHWSKLIDSLQENYMVCAMLQNVKNGEGLDCFKYWGQPFENMVAMIKTADIIVSADSGAAHLSSTLEKKTIVLFGPTIPQIVFGHEPNAFPIFSKEIECTGCNFAPEKGYKTICNGTCTSLHLITPKSVKLEIDALTI